MRAAAETYTRPLRPEDLPDHGCTENLSAALAPWDIAPVDIPSPFNLFQTLAIDGTTGRMANTSIRPRPGTYVDLRAEMDLLVAISACPDLTVGGKAIDVLIYTPLRGSRSAPPGERPSLRGPRAGCAGIAVLADHRRMPDLVHLHAALREGGTRMVDRNGGPGGDPNVARWTREGFVGDSTYIARPHHTPDFLAVEGAHAPHRLRLQDLALPDRDDPAALPVPILAARAGFRISASWPAPRRCCSWS